jgi:uncharacterized protein YlbG (UPF0298 family)
MKDLETKRYFIIIDMGLDVFNAGKGLTISKENHSDWLVFDERSIDWIKNGLDYFMQIFPHFDEDENIVSWTLYGAVSYDTKKSRYLLNYSEADKIQLDEIAKNIVDLLEKTYNYITNIKKATIPHAIDFNF